MSTRTPRQPLSRERVLTAAVGLADTEGLPAVTMRRLAGALGVEAMSLYYHLPGKDGLLDGLVDTVVREIDVAIAARESAEGTGDDGWRTALRRRCLSAREVMLRHPWAPGLMGSRRDDPGRGLRPLRGDPGHARRRRVLVPPRPPGAARARQHGARLRAGALLAGGGRW